VALKPVVWIGASYDDPLAFPEDVKDDFGYALYLGQTGELSDKAKPMRGVLRDIVEIVTSDPGGTYRLMYTVKLGKVIYVLHAFQKKSKRGSETPKAELELIERRLRIARIKHENRDD
jgi:phage-related protein